MQLKVAPRTTGQRLYAWAAGGVRSLAAVSKKAAIFVARKASDLARVTGMYSVLVTAWKYRKCFSCALRLISVAAGIPEIWSDVVKAHGFVGDKVEVH